MTSDINIVKELEDTTNNLFYELHQKIPTDLLYKFLDYHVMNQRLTNAKVSIGYEAGRESGYSKGYDAGYSNAQDDNEMDLA